MKKILGILWIVGLTVGLIIPAVGASAHPAQETIPGGKLVLGGLYTLESGKTLDGDLLVMGGNVALQEGSTVDGDVAMLGGNLQANGTVTGSLFGLGALVQMSSTSQVDGDVNVLGGDLQGATQADVAGQIHSDTSASLPIIIPGGLRVPVPNLDLDFNPVWDFLWLLLQSTLWAAVAVLTALLAPKAVQRVGESATSQALISGALGLLTAVVAPLILVVVSLTIIGIPIAFLALVALILAWAFGMIAIGCEVGGRLAKAAKANWALPLSAALGTFLVTLVVNSVGKIVPCVGWLVPFVVGIVGLGAVFLTRFGSRHYPAETFPAAAEIETTPPAAQNEGQQ